MDHSFADDFQLQMTNYPNYFTLCSHVYAMSMLGQLQTCLSLTTTRHNSCFSPLVIIDLVIQQCLLSFWYYDGEALYIVTIYIYI